MKKIIQLDMDDTIANFRGHPMLPKNPTQADVYHMYEVGFFRSLQVIDGALIGVRKLIRMGYDVQICSQPLAESAHSYMEKVQWIALHFPDLIHKINLTQDKGLIKGDYLIDDNPGKWKEKFEANGGKFIHFDYEKNHAENWHQITEFLKKELENG